MNKTFPAKILLFGEHIINKGSNGLATPFYSYHSTLSFEKNETSIKESKVVLELILNQILNTERLKALFNTSKLQEDISKNLQINMNIPIGYGLGSSGAICAGVYDAYCISKSDNPQEIKTILGTMEGAFHGKSSGLDPLVSYLEKSVLVTKEDTKIKEFDLKNVTEFHTFLIDTKQARKTAPLVNLFLAKYDSDKYFAEFIDYEIIPQTNEIISDILSDTLTYTYYKIGQLSRLHFDSLKFLILEKHLKIWENALDNDDFYLKICGAGGGGFMLGFCKDKTKVLEVFGEDEVIFV